ncbi:MAG: LysR family transcriptional regulator [Proteobacteria bacterium]|nr:LysR family transcriptional regulator [Pseudomonadota bacterium]
MVDISQVDLNLLRVLELLAEELSVTRVASRLGRAQPTISADLKKLREIFGDPLFVRHARGLKPTVRMEALKPKLQGLMRGLEAIVEPPVFDPRRATKTFQIVCGDYSEWLILPKLCAILAVEAPGIRVAVVNHVMGMAQKQLDDGEIDLAISVPRLTPSWLQQRLLVEDKYCVVARKGHPRLKGGRISIDQFCEEVHAVTVRDANIFEPTTTDRALAELGKERRSHFITRNYSSALRVIEQTDLIGMGLHGILPLYPNLQSYAAPFKIVPMRLLANWHERSQTDPAHVWLRQKLALVTRGMRPG